MALGSQRPGNQQVKGWTRPVALDSGYTSGSLGELLSLTSKQLGQVSAEGTPGALSARRLDHSNGPSCRYIP